MVPDKRPHFKLWKGMEGLRFPDKSSNWMRHTTDVKLKLAAAQQPQPPFFHLRVLQEPVYPWPKNRQKAVQPLGFLARRQKG